MLARKTTIPSWTSTVSKIAKAYARPYHVDPILPHLGHVPHLGNRAPRVILSAYDYIQLVALLRAALLFWTFHLLRNVTIMGPKAPSPTTVSTSCCPTRQENIVRQVRGSDASHG